MLSITRHARALVPAAACLLAVVLTPAPAAAQPEMITPGLLRLPAQTDNCPDGYLCVYRDIGHGGGGFAVNGGRALNDFRGIDFNDHMSSWINETGSRYCWYEHINYNGTRFGMTAGDHSHAVNPENNDVASALEPC
ncbi:peptidase inhibitor family I36 protein [Streptomyces sp. NPDC008343]|uniref:peptidase inhibitor family I36 protein n=1 Tax=Streptomyces sp. NPDC008343 TaxID=3364828 RepID=UPI0036EF5F0F